MQCKKYSLFFRTVWKDVAYHRKKKLISGILNHVLWTLCHVTVTLVSSFQGNQDTQNFCDIDSYIKSSKDGQFKVSSDIVSEVQ